MTNTESLLLMLALVSFFGVGILALLAYTEPKLDDFESTLPE